MRRALTYARDFDALIVHQTEDPDLIGDGVMNESEFAARSCPARRAEGGGNRNAGARLAIGGAHRRTLSRGIDHLRESLMSCAALRKLA